MISMNEINRLNGMNYLSWMRMMDAILTFYTDSKIKYATIKDTIDFAILKGGVIEFDLQKDSFLGKSKSARYRNYKILEKARIIRKLEAYKYEINPRFIKVVSESKLPSLWWD